jgi:RNA polymerase sigma-70 factor, ECF subfamily
VTVGRGTVDADTPDDETLVAAHVAGDPDAFDLLVARYDRRVYGICHRYFGDVADAEDAAQEAFVTLLRRADRFSGAARFSTWMYRVTMNVCHDLARRRSRRPRTVPLERPNTDGDASAAEPVDQAPDVEDVIASRELTDELVGALRHLDPDQREAVLLHDAYGLGYAEVAARVGVAVGTAKSRVHRGHVRLAAVLAGNPARAGDIQPDRP